MPEKKKKKKSAELEKSPISAAELKQLPWLQELCAGISSPEAAFGAGGVLHALKKAVLETVLEQEMSSHLGYAKHERNESSNSRNGVSSKTVQTESGPVQVSIPRDRSGTFEPQLLPKHRRRLAGFDEKVIALYSRGLSMREMSSHLKELYGAEVSPALISSVTDAVWSEAQDWLKRPLETVYPIVYLDALFVSVILAQRSHGAKKPGREGHFLRLLRRAVGLSRCHRGGFSSRRGSDLHCPLDTGCFALCPTRRQAGCCCRP